MLVMFFMISVYKYFRATNYFLCYTVPDVTAKT